MFNILKYTKINISFILKIMYQLKQEKIYLAYNFLEPIFNSFFNLMII